MKFKVTPYSNPKNLQITLVVNKLKLSKLNKINLIKLAQAKKPIHIFFEDDVKW